MAEEEKATGHARVETSNFLMIVLIFIVVSMGGLVEIVPLFFQHSTTQPIEGLKPYTALQVAGRDVYIREGCNNCHSQMIRPFRAEALRRMNALAGSGKLGHHDLMDQRNVGLDVEDLTGQLGRTGFLASGGVDVNGDGAHACSPFFAALRTTTSEPLLPGTAPRTSSRPRSAKAGW